MPIDQWQKARDRDQAKRAARELADSGRLSSYEYVSDGLEVAEDEVIEVEYYDEVIAWLNGIIGASDSPGKWIPKPFSSELVTDAERAVTVLKLALSRRLKKPAAGFAAEVVCRLEDKGFAALFKWICDKKLRPNVLAILDQIEKVDYASQPVSVLLHCLGGSPDVRIEVFRALRARESEVVSQLESMIDKGKSSQIRALRLCRDFPRFWSDSIDAFVERMADSVVEDLRNEGMRTLSLKRQALRRENAKSRQNKSKQRQTSRRPGTQQRRRTRRGRRK